MKKGKEEINQLSLLKLKIKKEQKSKKKSPKNFKF